MKISQLSLTLGIIQSDQGHNMNFKFLSIYHNTNCQILFSALAHGRKLLLSIYVHKSDNNI